VVGVSRLDGRDLQEGPVTRKALELYMDWAHGRSGSDE
jgi:branched-chain amino acid aminotransferase